MSALVGTSPTRERLLAAARELIEEGGYGAAPVVAIAERTGVAAGTLYRHFPSKGDLFLEVFRSVCAGEERAMRAAADGVGPGAGAVARLEAVVGTFAERALQNPRLAWALLAEPVDQVVDAERLAYRERYAALIARELDAAINAGEIPLQEVALTAAALVGGCGEALVGPLSPVAQARPAPAEVVRSIQLFVRRAVGAA
ncbi:MAG TPA: TetR/AcrR family transcriptional regulator [Solirubrobacteraceae bacterium]|nr:TetR/AcrR family transcriptional regulator [Solirubrobacteraceae bacterium]